MAENAIKDPDEVARIVADWLFEQEFSTTWESSALDRFRVFDVHAPGSNGFSNETIMCTVSRKGRADERLVLRLAPTRHFLFLDADFSVQYKIMSQLRTTSVLVPRLGPFETNPRFFGIPFFSMQHIEGQIPADNLPYSMGGWVLDASPTDQAKAWWSGLSAMAEVHLCTWKSLDLSFLLHRGLDGQLDYYQRFLEWTTKTRPQPVAKAAFEWLVRHRPNSVSETTLCWGDARLGNMIFSNFEAVGVLDWEMACLGPPEMDLGWWLYFDRQFTEGLGVAPLPGFPTQKETIQAYESLLGRSMLDLEWWQIFAGFRFSVIMARLSDLLIESGQLPSDSDMATNNLATQFTAQLLGLKAPG